MTLWPIIKIYMQNMNGIFTSGTSLLSSIRRNNRNFTTLQHKAFWFYCNLPVNIHFCLLHWRMWWCTVGPDLQEGFWGPCPICERGAETHNPWRPLGPRRQAAQLSTPESPSTSLQSFCRLYWLNTIQYKVSTECLHPWQLDTFFVIIRAQVGRPARSLL